ncbi:hypothetical protein RUM44_013668 [Polyplax serrata]|uniref:Uncharacterized protein n=1 Tax=Polyplax serrata TaxID=468196 RepID=A0ABR1BJH6_POLSC
MSNGSNLLMTRREVGHENQEKEERRGKFPERVKRKQKWGFSGCLSNGETRWEQPLGCGGTYLHSGTEMRDNEPTTRR